MSATALLPDLKKRGVELSIDGDRLRWRAPRGIMTAETVETLRRHKPAIIESLTLPAPEISSSSAPIEVRGWDDKTAELIRWFLNTRPLAEPFELSKGVTVIRPALWWAAMRRDIAAGPGVGRAYTGALQQDLRRLAELLK